MSNFYSCKISFFTIAFSSFYNVLILYIFSFKCKDKIWFSSKRTFTCWLDGFEGDNGENNGGRTEEGGFTIIGFWLNVSNDDKLWKLDVLG